MTRSKDKVGQRSERGRAQIRPEWIPLAQSWRLPVDLAADDDGLGGRPVSAQGREGARPRRNGRQQHAAIVC